MTSEASVRAWDIVVVPFPYSERLAEKRRPALVVSADHVLAETGAVWIVMITSAGKMPRLGDLAIGDLGSAGLPGPSTIRASKIATVEPSRLLRTIGHLAQDERKPVLDALNELLPAL